ATPLPAKGGSAALARTDTGSAKSIEAIDQRGVLRVYALARRQSQLTSEPLLGVLSIPKTVLFADADRVLVQNLSWLGLAAAVALALGWFGSKLLIVRPLQALVSCTSRVAAGDFTVRTGLPHSHDELGRLTFTFDQMAEALEQRESEVKKNSQKLQAL